MTGQPGTQQVDGELSGEDAKLVVLARATRLRAHTPTAGPAAAEGAAVRDEDGRTYTGATVEYARGDLSLSALRVAVAAAVSSGARGFEAAVVVTDAPGLADDDVAAFGAFGAGLPVHRADPSGAVVETRTS
jgi:cytidine deaminase